MSDELHTLYRFFDADNNLLYVGITCSPPVRLKQHKREKTWWADVARIEFEQHESREALEAAEREAIPRENPRYNIMLRTARPPKPEGLTPRDIRGMKGLYFHTHGDRGWQGKITGRLGGGGGACIMIVQLFEWFMGEPSVTKLVRCDEMLEWDFFEDADEWRAAGDRIMSRPFTESEMAGV